MTITNPRGNRGKRHNRGGQHVLAENVTLSSYRSPAAGRSIALALVAGGRARIGQRVHVSTPAGRAAPATVAQPCAYDPEGARLHV